MARPPGFAPSVPAWIQTTRSTGPSCGLGTPSLPHTDYSHISDVALSGFLVITLGHARGRVGGSSRGVTTMRLFGGVALFCAGLTLETYVTGALNPVKRARLRAG